MDVIVLIARVLFAAIFIGSGLGHLGNADAMSGMLAQRGVSGGAGLVRLTGVVQLAGAAGIIVGVLPALAALGLAVFVTITAVVMHPFWRFEGQEQMQQQVDFLKNVSLAGGALLLFAIFAGVDGLGLMITGPAISL